jgi:hypothetical protein
MASKKETEKKLDYARGYRDALVDTWETVIKLATKGFSSRELQIMSKSNAMEAREQIDAKIAQLEAELTQNDAIDADGDIKLVGVAEAKPTMSVNMRPGMSYMVKEPKPARCYKMFEKEIAAGKVGLCVSRSSPTEIRDDYKIGKSQVIWLTSNEKLDTNLPPSALGVMTDDRDAAGANDEYVQPTALHIPYSVIINFLDGNHGGVVVFEGLEYLISHNKFTSVLNFLQKINEYFKNTNSILIVSVNPSAFEPKQLSQLETEMNQVLQ